MKPTRPSLVLSTSLCAALLWGVPATGAGAAPEGLSASSDFNGDGFADLAVGVALEDVGTVVDAGMVSVLYGGPDGLTASDDQPWSQNAQSVKGEAEEGDGFGWAVASGDFDGDGFADLAIGVPFEHLTQPLTDHAGQVNVLYGSASGLTADGNQAWSQDSPGVRDNGEGEDEFGSALATGDVNGDGFADLAVGVRGETLNGMEGAGAAHVLFGSANGLVGSGSQFITQDTTDIEDEAEPLDLFGVAVAIGDFDGDDFGDLAVGANGEDLGLPGSGVGDAGAVNVLYGSVDGVTAAGDQIWTQDTPGILGLAETADLMGSALAVGNFDADGFDDLAVSHFGENVTGDDLAGAASVLYGSAAGISADGNQYLTQDNANIPDVAEPDDHFGASLAAGNFDGDGFDDLALGVDGEDLSPTTDGGAAHVIHGSASGLNFADGQLWTQNTTNVEDSSENGDIFGYSLAAGNFGMSSHDDLAIGVRLEDVGAIEDAGAANVLYGTTAGLSATGDQFWNQDSQGVQNNAETGDWFSFGGMAAA